MKAWLEGKKTIIIQIVALLSASALYWKGELTQDQFLAALWLAFTAIFAAVKANRMIKSNGNGS